MTEFKLTKIKSVSNSHEVDPCGRISFGGARSKMPLEYSIALQI